MATNFPTALDTLTNPSASDNLGSTGVVHSDQHSDLNDAVEALQAKVGIDSSADTDSLDYKINNISLPAGTATLTGVETLTNKTLTAPVINSPTGIVKGDVGLGNVDNTSDATKNAAAVTLTNKTLTSPVINTPSFSAGAIGTADIADDAITPVKISNPYLLSAQKSVAQEDIADETWTKVTLGTENYDTNSNFATSTYTVPLNGWYSIKGQVYWTYPSNVEGVFACAIYIDGTIHTSNYENTGGTALERLATPCVARDLYLTAGQTVELYAYHNTDLATPDMPISANTFLTISLIAV